MESLTTVVHFMEATTLGKFQNSNSLIKHTTTVIFFYVEEDSNLTYLKYSEVYSESTRKWYSCNDSHVRPISSPDNSSSSAYILFYNRMS